MTDLLLDPNVVSELRKSQRRANPAVRNWAQAQRTGELFLSVITVMEVEIGVSGWRSVTRPEAGLKVVIQRQ